MEFKEYVQIVCDNFIDTRRSSEGVDSSSEVYDVIKNRIPQSLSKNLQTNKYKLKGSVGTGRWTDIPWIGVFNPKITTSAQKGFYVCYLFAKDMGSIYLTIIHSITKGKTGGSWSDSEIVNFVRGKQSRLRDALQENHIAIDNIKMDDAIDLGDTTQAKKYMKSTIAYLKYEVGKIPNDTELMEDFKKFILIYDVMAEVEGAVNLVETDPFMEEDLFEEDGNVDVIEEYIHLENPITHIQKYIKSKGFNYTLANIKNLYLSLRSKPFVIISGISGTGKTKIVQLFAESIGATEDNGQFTLIPVRPDWSDGSELLGYTDIKGDFIEGQLTKVVREASDNLDRPYFVLLDEMNLARVEYYFSDVLSIMESRKKDGDTYTSSTLIEIEGEKLTLPNNLYIIGTVNMDETTHPFSKKVLDRANTIEFNEIYLNDFSFLTNSDTVEPIPLANTSMEASFVQLKDCYELNKEIVELVSNELMTINKIIEPLNAHVGYRVRDEICFYMIYNNEGSLFKEDEAFDYCVMQKILPRLAGSGLKIRNVLEQLFEQFTGRTYTDNELFDTTAVRYPLSSKKVYDMLGRLRDEGFTSFWIS